MDPKSSILRKTALVLATILLYQAFYATPLMALTSGPSQPEFQSFQPAGVSDMVDLFSGNFNYNIPLLDVGGYPINISYSSDNGMDDEASWVGLGWTLNPGSITRQMRGLPDDFKDDVVTKQFNLKDDVTVSVQGGVELELFGRKKGKNGKKERNPLDTIGALTPSLTVTYNNRRGFELELGGNAGIEFKSAKKLSPKTANFGLGASPSKGLQLSSGAGFAWQSDKSVKKDLDLRLGYNSRQGLQGLTYQGKTGIRTGDNQFNLGSGHTFFPGPYSYTPTSALPIVNASGALHVTVGSEVFGANPNIELDASFSTQTLETNFQFQKGYGYLYLQDGEDKEENILDYNSELTGQIISETPHLPLAYGTPDMFIINGQGISGSFEATRADHGLFRPAKEVNNSNGGIVGGELGVGGFFKGGGNVQVTTAWTTNEVWKNNANKLRPILRFEDNDGIEESVFFKSSSDNVINTSARYNRTAKTDPIRASIKGQAAGVNINVSNQYVVENGAGDSFLPYQNSYTDTVRNIRNQNIAYRTFKETKNKISASNNRYKNYPTNRLNIGEETIMGSCNASLIPDILYPNAKDHHIAELDITQPDGSRYVFGQPVYNLSQKEVSFSVDRTNFTATEADKNINDVTDDNYGLVAYDTLVDNTVNNRKGDDHFFDAKTISPYAHSYLLTELLSPDYVDKTGDGVTDDDLGNAIKFNYSKSSDYKWRIPFRTGKAKHHPGLKSTFNDDKASYLYGEREVWYQHSIESRTMVALFHTSPREDGLGVITENGGVKNTDNSKLRKLDKIELFSKSELLNNPTDPTPIKTVNFEYDYSSCKGIYNHSENLGASRTAGKLTLKQIYFTYGKNMRGKLNAYNLDYKNDQDYHLNHYDRWGFFKKNPENYQPHHDFPYVLQHEDADSTQAWAGQWNLNEIELPSGGIINIDYESDDYAYVQDKRSADMLEVLGFTYTLDGPITTDLYDGLNGTDNIVVKLPVNVSDEEEARIRYLDGIDKIYVNALIELSPDNRNEPDTRERVSGYIDIDKKNIRLRDNDKLIIPINKLSDGRGTDIPALTFAGIQVMKFQRPELIYPGYRKLEGESDIGNIAKGLLTVLGELVSNIVGFEKKQMLRNRAKKVIVSDNSTWARLCNPNYKKLGGGSRVKEITISDEWNQGLETSSTYGQKYTYTKQAKVNGAEIEISSGVASYEPAIGGEENLLKTPLAYETKKILAPKSLFYSESPIGESLYPGASIGYSQVTVSDIANSNPNIDRTKSGQTIHEFYTAKDFPTIVKTTGVQTKNSLGAKAFSFLNKTSISSRGVSQGFVIELNDMHGKPLRQTVLDKNDVPLTSTEYRYQENNSPNKRALDNTVKVIDDKGNASSAELGVDVCLWQEMWQEDNVMTTPGVQLGVDGFPVGIIPALIPTVYPDIKFERNTMQGTTATKLVKRKGILNKVIVTENGSTIETENVAYDRETGNVLLTRTQNEFNDDMYAFNYPAHWVYDNMGQAYGNSNAVFRDIRLVQDKYLPSNLVGKLNPGDQVLVTANALGRTLRAEAYVATNEFLNNQLVLLKVNGKGNFKASIPLEIKVIRSAKKNMAATSIGQITSRLDPLLGSSIAYNSNSKVINASAMTYKDQWDINCETQESNTVLEIKSAYNFKSNGLSQASEIFINQWMINGEIINIEQEVNSLEELSSILSSLDNGNSWETNGNIIIGGSPENTYGMLEGMTMADNLTFSIYSTDFEIIEENGSIVYSECFFNPYTSGYLNQHRPESSYVFYNDRSPSDVSARNVGMRIKDEGYAESFTPYWNYNAASAKWESVSTSNDEWTFTNKVTQYDEKGNELENVNAIGVYSAAQFGYKDALAVAVANNADSREIWFESFEDISFDNNCEDRPLNAKLDLFQQGENVELTDNYAHSGFHSLKYTTPEEYRITLLPICEQCIELESSPTGITLNGLPTDVSTTLTDFLDNPPNDSPTIIDSDDCDEPGVISSFVETSSKTPCAKIITRTWTAEDPCGNTGSFSQDIIIQDDISPTITGFDSPFESFVELDCDDPIPAKPSIVEYEETNLEGNLQSAGADVFISEDLIIGPGAATLDCDQGYTIYRTIDVVDACYNSSGESQIIYIKNSDGSGGPGGPGGPGGSGTLPLTEIETHVEVSLSEYIDNPINDTPVIGLADNCTELGVVTSFSQDSIVEDCLKIVWKTWTAEDPCGNSGEFTQYIIIEDDIEPSITDINPSMDSPLELSCEDEVPLEPVVEFTDITVNGEAINPASSIVIPDQIIYGPGADDLDCELGYNILRSIIVVDACFNKTQLNQLISVGNRQELSDDEDCNSGNEAITFTDFESETTLSLNNYLSNPPTDAPQAIPASDCFEALEVVYSETINTNVCPNEIKRIWTATDPCGNGGCFVQTILVTDDISPIIVRTIPEFQSEIRLDCDESIPSDPSVIFSEVNAKGTQTNAGAQVSIADNVVFGDPDNCDQGYILERTITVADACGNSQTLTQTIIIGGEEESLVRSAAKSRKNNSKASIPASNPDYYQYNNGQVTYPFVNTCAICLPSFTPYPGENYSLSTWISTDESMNSGTAPSGQIMIRDQDDNLITTLEPFGPVIEGWQRIQGKIELPIDITSIKLIIDNESVDMYVDDFRFNPFLSNMNSYVYDPFSLRLMATLDENNYASFYEYDDEGILIRVKRETEKGIATVQEGRTVLKPNNSLDDD